MIDTMLNNWNNTVSNQDTVYIVGDVALGRTKFWLDKLTGKKVLILGNHDDPKQVESVASYILTIGGQQFLLIHDPGKVKSYPNWNGWVICGHTHNSNPDYPFINTPNKTINVSVELINYTPLNIEELSHVNRFDFGIIKDIDEYRRNRLSFGITIDNKISNMA
jgi:calcineurin-like phosphoesterase family protein